MSERIFACLLRLYPTRFREQYGDEALRLYRDRARDERGFIPRLRLWGDLVFDLAISLPREYRLAGAQWITAPAIDGVPSFAPLVTGSPRLGSLLMGTAVSVASLLALAALMNHVSGVQHSAAWERAFNRFSEGFWSQQSTRQRQRFAAAPATATASGSTPLDRDKRHEIVVSAAEYLKQHYSDPAAGERAANAIASHEKNGDDDSAMTTTDLAKLLTAQIREATDDHDIELLYRERPIPERPEGPPPSVPAAMREQMLHANCGFEKLEVLPHKVGYVKLNMFAMQSVCADMAKSNMARLNDANAVIFDLRDNRGGFDLGKLLASYLFDHPEYFYSPIENTTRESWTSSPVAGSKLADKPVYVLTSSHTISAAEQFTFNLKMLKRAVVVGETTAGGAHAANFHALGNNFYLGTVDVTAINPYSKYDWNGTGIEPDVKVPAADALNTALNLAERQKARQ